MKALWLIKIGLLATLVVLLDGKHAPADQIDKELLAATLPVLDHIKAKNAKVVGVLKFRGRRGTGEPSFHFGPINNVMADRVENMLLLGHDADDAIDVIHDATLVAGREGLSYATADGRRKLFTLDYPLAAGGKSAKPDLLLTGTVTLDTDFKKTTVLIESFGRDGKEPEKVLEFVVNTERATLADAGRGYVLERSLVKRDGAADYQEPAEQPAKRDEVALDDAFKRANKIRPAALTSNERLVDLKVFYNDAPIPLAPDAADAGNASFTAPDPKKGDVVHFLLHNHSTQKVAVVLKINGLNTVREETDEPAYCTKWVLVPGKELVVDGFYVKESGPNNVKKFTVLGDDESDTAFTRNGTGDLNNERLGTIGLHVFVEGDKPAAGDAPVTATRGLSPLSYKSATADYSSLRKQLFATQSKTRGRGLIAPDGSVKDGSRLVKEDFQYPVEKEYVFIRYYQPGMR